MPSGFASRFLLPLALLLLAACSPVRASNEDWLLEAHLDKTRSYPGEPVRLTVRFLVGQVSVRNIQYPHLERTGLGPGEFSAPVQSRQSRDGRDYIAYAFTTTLTPRGSGTLEIGPVELGFDLLEAGGGAAAFFGGTEPRAVTARATPVLLRVLPLPARGRPENFSGAVGHFHVTREIEPDRIRSGEAVTLRTRIQGNDAASRFSCPALNLPGTRGYPPRDRREGNVLACEQVLLVDAVDDLSIPAARINFFDPRTGRYDTASSQPVRLEITPPRMDENPGSSPPPQPRERMGDVPATSWWPAFIGLAPPLIWLLWLAWRRRGHSARMERSATRHAHILSTLENAREHADPTRFYAEAHRFAQNIAAERLGKQPAGITAGDLVSAAEVQGGMSGLADLLRECDAVRYGDATPDLPRLLRQLRSEGPAAKAGNDCPRH